MRTQRQVFPYVRGTSIFVRPEALNLLAQVKLSGETWTMCLERIVRGWARENKVTLTDSPTELQGLRTRQALAWSPVAKNDIAKLERQERREADEDTYKMMRRIPSND